MAAKPKLKIAERTPPPPTPEETAPVRSQIQNLNLQEFARRLNELMISAGMNQSQLAAAVFGTVKDTRGFTVARGRDRISNYLRGRDVPRTANLAKIAKVFSMTASELAPELTASALDKGDPAVSMRMVAGRPDRVHLTVNTMVDLTTAARVIDLISRSQKSGDGS